VIIDEFGDEHNLSGEIKRNFSIVQPFVAKERFLKSVSVAFATYKRRNYCNVAIKILDSHQNQIARRSIHGTKIIDNAFHNFDVQQKLAKGQTYFLVVFSDDGSYGNGLTAKWGASRHNNKLSVVIDNNPIYGELACSFVYTKKQEDQFRSEPVIVSRDELAGLVSIVVPAYNCSQYLGKCLEQIASQTYNCVEVIIVDDGSDDADAAEDIVLDAQDKYPFPIKFIRHSKNRGANAARNTGYYETRGEYLFFLDADCFLAPNAFEMFLSELSKNSDKDYAYCNYKIDHSVYAFQPFDPVVLKRKNYICTMSMIRRRAFPGFDETQERLQDWDLWLTMLTNGSRGVWINKVLFETPKREDGITLGNRIQFPAAYWKVKNKDKFWDQKTGRSDVSALMVVYKTPELFRRAYESFRNFYSDIKLVVVDGSGGDECTRCVKEAEQNDENMVGIYYDYNVGHGPGMHIGITYIRTPFIYIFDSDTEMISGGIIDEMLSKFGPDTYGSGKVEYVNDNGSNVSDSARGFPYLHPAVLLIRRSAYMRHKPFRHHGAPCIDAMRDIFYSKKSDKVIIPFSVSQYVVHDKRGTRGKFGLTRWSRR
jgi:glycosyltransferase involved in cell wall biosynthesis